MTDIASVASKFWELFNSVNYTVWLSYKFPFLVYFAPVFTLVGCMFIIQVFTKIKKALVF